MPVFVLLASVAGFLMWSKNSPKTSVAQGSGAQKTTSTFYPTQYSDKHITQNAITTDPKYKDVSFVNKKDFLANIVSSLPAKPAPKSEPFEKGTWLWTPISYITPEYRDSIIAGAKKDGIKNIYISIDTYLDIYVMPNGPEKDRAKKNFDDTLESFVTEAHKNNMTVDAEAGWQNWAEEGNLYKPLTVLDYVLKFNKAQKEKLRGFQYDVEPYMLPSYQNDKATVLYNFVSLVDQTASVLKNQNIQFSVVIPEFYDSKSAETPAFSYGGKNAYTIDHLLSVLEQKPGSKIIVMAYRNFTKGDDGSIDVSRDEISRADGYQTKIIVAQETGDVLPPYVTFHNTPKSYYEKQLTNIHDAFIQDKSYGGVATHYVNALLEL